MSGYFCNRDSLALGKILRRYYFHSSCVCLFLLFGHSPQHLQKEFESSNITLLSTLWQNNHNRNVLKPSHRTNPSCWKSFLPWIICHSNKRSAKYNFTKWFILQNPKLSILIWSTRFVLMPNAVKFKTPNHILNFCTEIVHWLFLRVILWL